VIGQGMQPLYGTIIMTRTRGHLGAQIVCAPTVALIAPEMLAAEKINVRVVGRMITLMDQVVYRITGWDDDQQALIVLLERDMR
jgi:hypothetical protein